MITTVRVQEKGQMSVPRFFRKQLNLKKGDLVTFVNAESGVVIKPLRLAVDGLLKTLATSLQSRCVRLEEVMARS